MAENKYGNSLPRGRSFFTNSWNDTWRTFLFDGLQYLFFMLNVLAFYNINNIYQYIKYYPKHNVNYATSIQNFSSTGKLFSAAIF